MEPFLPMPENSESSVAPGQNVPEQVQSVQPAEVAPNVQPELPREGGVAGVTAVSPTQPTPVQPVMPAVSSATSSTVPGDDPLIADDVDVIEKEWVDKAKRIVGATKEDPYTQEKEVSKLQADYLMKRYNKQIKLSE